MIALSDWRHLSPPTDRAPVGQNARRLSPGIRSLPGLFWVCMALCSSTERPANEAAADRHRLSQGVCLSRTKSLEKSRCFA